MQDNFSKPELVLHKLRSYVEQNNYCGYDVYDGLEMTNNRLLVNTNITNLLITQFFKKCPVNFRSLAGIKKRQMAKSFGIFLNAYSLLIESSKNEEEKKQFLQKAEYLLQWLDENKLKNYSGSCWKFGFKYRFMFDAPTAVITSIIAKGLHQYYLVTGSGLAKNLLLNTKDFILKDLPQTTDDDGICFSYTPIKKDNCYNASLLAAETLARVYSINNDKELLPVIDKAVIYVINKQKPDGRWNYSLDVTSGKERPQIDFHQGYVLESIFEIRRLTGINSPVYDNAIEKGTDFYFKNQFFSDGRAKWRIPKEYPIDIHNQAQAIIYFSMISKGNDEKSRFATTVLDWTINNMFSPGNYFYYQVHRLYKIKIPYMRWSQAWMMLAMCKLLKKSNR